MLSPKTRETIFERAAYKLKNVSSKCSSQKRGKSFLRELRTWHSQKYNPYPGILWTHFPPIFRKSESQSKAGLKLHRIWTFFSKTVSHEREFIVFLKYFFRLIQKKVKLYFHQECFKKSTNPFSDWDQNSKTRANYVLNSSQGRVAG